MSAIEDEAFFKILKEMDIFLTNISGLSLRVFCYTPLDIPRYEDH
jgi:hypothetical protein